MKAHLADATVKNKRNGKGKKVLKTNLGSVEIETSADRNSSFEPTIVKKRQTILADSLSDKIIGLYGLGMRLCDISNHIKEICYGYFPHEITDKIIPKVKAWQSRPLESILYLWARRDALQSKGRWKI